MQKLHIGIQFSEAIIVNRLYYVCSFIEQHPLTANRILFCFDKKINSTLLIDYQKDSDSGSSNYYIPRQELVFIENSPASHTLVANTYQWKAGQLYAVEPQQKPEQPFLIQQQFQFDIFESIFFHISRYEEWACPEEAKDQWDMMKEEAQFLVANGLEQRAIVDELVAAFLEGIGLEVPAQETSYRITHDIDAVRSFQSWWSPIRATAGLIKKGQGFGAIKRLWQSYWGTKAGLQKDPFDNFETLLSTSEKHQKVIYFLVGGDSIFDTPFNLNTDRMQAVFGLCKQRAYAIGIHPSYNSWKNKSLITSELQYLSNVIDESIQRSRQHYLHFSFAHTPYYFDELGITEDSSLGYNYRIGFRCGTGFPYRLYDFKNERAFRFLEVPMVLMDSALLKQANYKGAEVQRLFHSFLASNALNTFITFNFHNTRFFDAWLYAIPLEELYLDLIA